MEKVIILGSANSFGNTKKTVDKIVTSSDIKLFDLNDFDISLFDYLSAKSTPQSLAEAELTQKPKDDFLPLMDQLITYDTWIIATPVYWYQMSTQHKIFFDRFSDLLTIHKDLGRKLRGKKLFVIASFGTSYPRGFEDTFEQICEYLGMNYLGTSFIYSGSENPEFHANNKAQIQKARSVLFS